MRQSLPRCIDLDPRCHPVRCFKAVQLSGTRESPAEFVPRQDLRFDTEESHMNMRSGASAAAIILAASLTWAGAAQAQENSNSASTTLAQTSQMPGMTGQQQGTQPGQPGMMGPGMG